MWANGGIRLTTSREKTKIRLFGDSRYARIPADMHKDSAHPFQETDEQNLIIEIDQEKEQLVVRRPREHEPPTGKARKP